MSAWRERQIKGIIALSPCCNNRIEKKEESSNKKIKAKKMDNIRINKRQEGFFSTTTTLPFMLEITGNLNKLFIEF